MNLKSNFRIMRSVQIAPLPLAGIHLTEIELAFWNGHLFQNCYYQDLASGQHAFVISTIIDP